MRGSGVPSLIDPVMPAGSLGGRPQPVLRTADGALALRPFEASDAPAVFDAFTDPGIRRWHVRSMESPDEAREWIEAAGRQWAADERGEWAIVPGGGVVGDDARTDDADDDGGRAAGPLAGRICVRTLDLEEGIAAVGYWVVPAARGQGVARRALEAATRWAFSAGFHRIELDHATANVASCRVAEHAGYAAEGVRRSAALHEEGWLDMHVHARIAP